MKRRYDFGRSKYVFVSTWKTDNTSTGSSTSTQVKLPTIATGTYACTVDWGDGFTTSLTTATYNTANTHTYAIAGTYTIKIKGTCYGWQFNNTGDRLKILSIQSWGKLRLGTTQGFYFYGCANLNLSGVGDVLDLTGTSSLRGLFYSCTNLTTVNFMNSWYTSGVNDIQEMCALATNFNQNIGSWITGGITNMQSTFFSAQKFNQDISLWNTGAVLSFQNMFVDAQRFNQNIGGWITNLATNMGGMFSSAIDFNQNIGNWNVSNVTNFINFMSGKTPATFSTANLNAIYNGWSNRPLKPSITITFGTAKYTSASSEGRALLTRTLGTKAITNVVNNGSGLIRITATGHGLTTNNKILISGIVGTVEANNAFNVTVIDANTIDLQSSTFTNAYVSGGTAQVGNGYTITDGGI